MTTVLAIDTVSPQAIALAVTAMDGGDPYTSVISTDMNHAAVLVGAIDALLGAARVGELAAIAVTSGPGSYGGLRVGIATAEGLAFARGIPLHGVPTLVAVDVAARASGGPEFLHATHPAGRGEAAVQPFVAGEPIGTPSILTAAESRTVASLYGEGAGALGGVEMAPLERCLAVLAVALERVLSGERSPGIVPVYLREPSITRAKRTPLIPPSSLGAA